MTASLMIYGATGYTGRLLARAAKEQGLSPLLAGRSEEKLARVARPLGFEHRAISLADTRALQAAVAKVDVVLHAAGPFSATAEPMVDACLRGGTHYLDITGEIDVFEACAARDGEAREKKVVVMPGVGFDVVPSDCLAAHVKRRLPDATSLEIGIHGLTGMSRGTAKSGAESVRRPSRVRRNGRIVDAPRPLFVEMDYGSGPQKSLSVSWGDVSTAYHSTGISDITVYFAATRQLEKMAAMGPWTRWFLGTSLMQTVIKRRINKQPEGPSDEKRAQGKAILVAMARNGDGQKVTSRLSTPEGYTLTCMTGLEIASRVMRGEVEPGFLTPSKAFGPDLITEFEGCVQEDVD